MGGALGVKGVRVLGPRVLGPRIRAEAEGGGAEGVSIVRVREVQGCGNLG